MFVCWCRSCFYNVLVYFFAVILETFLHVWSDFQCNMQWLLNCTAVHNNNNFGKLLHNEEALKWFTLPHVVPNPWDHLQNTNEDVWWTSRDLWPFIDSKSRNEPNTWRKASYITSSVVQSQFYKEMKNKVVILVFVHKRILVALWIWFRAVSIKRVFNSITSHLSIKLYISVFSGVE